MFLLVGMRCDLIWLSTMSAAAALRPFLRLRNRNILDVAFGERWSVEIKKGGSWQIGSREFVLRAGWRCMLMAVVDDDAAVVWGVHSRS
uniref:Putative secreted protein n=1 Tax=Anopheles marajoara TaxID=58244 RepID=A0A2M4CAA0_9DIPT